MAYSGESREAIERVERARIRYLREVKRRLMVEKEHLLNHGEHAIAGVVDDAIEGLLDEIESTRKDLGDFEGEEAT